MRSHKFNRVYTVWTHILDGLELHNWTISFCLSPTPFSNYTLYIYTYLYLTTAISPSDSPLPTFSDIPFVSLWLLSYIIQKGFLLTLVYFPSCFFSCLIPSSHLFMLPLLISISYLCFTHSSVSSDCFLQISVSPFLMSRSVFISSLSSKAFSLLSLSSLPVSIHLPWPIQADHSLLILLLRGLNSASLHTNTDIHLYSLSSL